MPQDKKTVISALLRKGFRLTERDHHYFFYYDLSGNKTPVHTKISHGSDRQISDYNLAKMARQCRLARKQFLNLVDCSIEWKDYDEILRQNRIIGHPSG